MRQGAGDRGTRPLDEHEIAAMRAWLQSDGELAVAAACGLARLPVVRAAAGLGVHAGSRLAMRAALAARRGT
jgi:hypothetical protein